MGTINGILVWLFLFVLIYYIVVLIKPSLLNRKGNILGRKRTNLIFIPLILVLLISIGSTAPPETLNSAQSNKVNQTSNTSQPTNKKAATLPKVEQKTVTETQTIPFDTQTQNDASLPSGQTKTVQTGQNGTKTLTYKVTYTDGKETSRALSGEAVTTQPVSQIVANGTYVAPVSQGSSYTNVDGNSVQSPSNNPAGATAQCRDGTYSYSQNHSGTCSHHGGVAVWY